MADFAISRYRGDTYADEFVITDNATGQPLNITGYAFKLSLDRRRKPTDNSTLYLTLIGTITDAAGGVVEFSPADASEVNRVGMYYADIQMIDGIGRIKTISSGTYEITQDVTKN